MSALRRRLSHYAALVLLVWLFACGAAFAQACNAHVHAAADDCCTTMQASAIRPDASSDFGVTTPSSQPWLLDGAMSAPTVAVQPQTRDIAVHARVWNDSGQRIPILFLRLAL